MTRPLLNEALISVVLPVFNEAKVLEELRRRVQSALAACGTGQEIIFVNDGSTDDTAQILDSLAQRHSHVRVIHLARNFGHQAAIQAGLCHARGDAVVLMDSDLQDSPEAIGRLVAEWITGYDVVYAVRRDRPEAIWKRCLFAGFHALLSRVASNTIPSDAGNFSIIDARVVREIVALGERDRYLPGLRGWVGFKQRGVEVSRERRYDDRPRVSLGGLFRLAKTAIFSFSSFPLTLFYVIAYSSLLAFVMLGSYALICKALTTLSIPGWTSNVLVASFFGAINSLGICILGEYVIRIYDQVRGRPMFVVDQTRNLHPAADNFWPEDETATWPGADRRTARDRRAANERRAAAERRDAVDRRSAVGRRAGSDWQGADPDFGSEDYLAFDAEFAAAGDLAGDDWRTQLETDEDYEDLIAEAESLMALVLPATTGAKLHAPPTDVDSTADADADASVDDPLADRLVAQSLGEDPLNQDPLIVDSLSTDEMWLVGNELPNDAQPAAPANWAADDEVVIDERLADKRTGDKRAGDKRAGDRKQSTGRRNAPEGHGQAPDSGSPTKAKAGRRGRKRKERDDK
ncbi:MAG TPA: glycosyltransferase family 2 protein [Pirellulales bacterium]|jgi:dolichol-phosphate mannosyltransferase|nr:glycosyltransferase family 2 protein [Pirellulales bacterium]